VEQERGALDGVSKSHKESAQALGRAYARLVKSNPDLSQSEILARGAQEGLSRVTEIMTDLATVGKLTTFLQNRMAECLHDISPSLPSPLPVDVQPFWWIGYYDELTKKDGLLKKTDESRNLVNLRTKAGLTQAQLAETLGVVPQQVAKWENGVKPNRSSAQRLAEIYGVSITDISERFKESE
jgi:DNA-binding XRE family transcriptional regulator